MMRSRCEANVPGRRPAAKREEARLEEHRTKRVQAGGRNPARVTVTRRRTAALDVRLLAAVRAWRQ